MVDEDDRACYIVAGSKTWWLIQPRHYFWVDSGPVLRAQKENWPEKYFGRDIEEEIRTFRGGFPVLTADNIEAYLATMPEAVATTEEMRRTFASPNLSALRERVVEWERQIVLESGTEGQARAIGFDEELIEYQRKLPYFYLNFNTKCSISMFYETSDHENIPVDWNAFDQDFGALVPSWDKYWVVDGVSYWSLTLCRF